jgi:hypothetical protein
LTPTKNDKIRTTYRFLGVNILNRLEFRLLTNSLQVALRLDSLLLKRFRSLLQLNPILCRKRLLFNLAVLANIKWRLRYDIILLKD